MDKSYKKPLLLITFGVILFAAFNNLNYVANFLKSCIGLLAPILSGLLLCPSKPGNGCGSFALAAWHSQSLPSGRSAGLCSECTRARTGKEASTKAD